MSDNANATQGAPDASLAPSLVAPAPDAAPAAAVAAPALADDVKMAAGGNDIAAAGSSHSLAGSVFVVTPGVPAAVGRTIEAAGGLLKRTVPASASGAANVFVVASQADAAHAKAAQARAAGIPVVLPTFVASALARGLGAIKTSHHTVLAPVIAAPKVDVKVPKKKKRAVAAASAAVKKRKPRRAPAAVPAAVPAAAPAAPSSPAGAVIMQADLSCIDLSRNYDKYYTMRVLASGGGWDVVRHWGRTGTPGQTVTSRFASLQDATRQFTTLFREKTGCSWEARQDACDRSRASAGKYTLLLPQAKAAAAGATMCVWQYTDGVSGVLNGPAIAPPAASAQWVNYNKAASDLLEAAYAAYVRNPAHAGMHCRCVRSGKWLYRVSFTDMTQTNVEHTDHTRRYIRRVPCVY